MTLRAVIALFMAGLFWSSCSTPESKVGDTLSSPVARAEATLAPTPDLSSTPLDKPVHLEKTIIESKQGQKWQLEADRLDWSNSNEKAKAYEVTWFLLDPGDKRSIRVESTAADVDLNAQVVTFVGAVRAERLGSSETFIVNKLIYDGKKRIFKGSQGVKWKRQGFELAGEELTADAELSKVQLKGGVKGQSMGASFQGGTNGHSGGDR